MNNSSKCCDKGCHGVYRIKDLYNAAKEFEIDVLDIMQCSWKYGIYYHTFI